MNSHADFCHDPECDRCNRPAYLARIEKERSEAINATTHLTDRQLEYLVARRKIK